MLLSGAGLGAQPWGHCRREGQASGGGAALAQVERGLPAAPLLRQPPARRRRVGTERLAGAGRRGAPAVARPGSELMRGAWF